MEFVPHEYQSDGIRFLTDNEIGALFLDPGLGKTAIVLSCLKNFKIPTLVIADIDIMYRTWRNELKKWDFSQNIKYTILHGPDKEARFLKRYGIYLINPAGIQWLHKMIKKHKRMPFGVLVIDESTIFKNHQTKRYSSLIDFARLFSRRYILTGTPMPKSYLDLWAQYYILDFGARLGHSYYSYRNKYFYATDHRRWNWIILPGTSGEILDQVEDITYRISAEDSGLDLPERVINHINVDLPDDMLKQYRQMERKYFIEIDDEKITADAAGAKVQKLQQIANGFIYTSAPDPKNPAKKIRTGSKRLHTAKVDALESLIKELNGNPLLVGFHFREELDILLERFPKTPVFHGSVDIETKVRLERKWNKGQIPVIFAQIAATSRGLNLQGACSHVAFYSLTYNLEHYDQFIKRVQRQGNQFSRVIVHLIMSQKTIDHMILEVLSEKDENQRNFLNAFIKYRKRVLSDVE